MKPPPLQLFLSKICKCFLLTWWSNKQAFVFFLTPFVSQKGQTILKVTSITYFLLGLFRSRQPLRQRRRQKLFGRWPHHSKSGHEVHWRIFDQPGGGRWQNVHGGRSSGGHWLWKVSAHRVFCWRNHHRKFVHGIVGHFLSPLLWYCFIGVACRWIVRPPTRWLLVAVTFLALLQTLIDRRWKIPDVSHSKRWLTLHLVQAHRHRLPVDSDHALLL